MVLQEAATGKGNSVNENMAKINGSRILLVEDNEMNQELAMELLIQAGVEVVLAENGKVAVDILSKDSRFDGVLMDCQMPVMDGYTATRTIRKDDRYQKLPILAMTANAMAGDKEKVLDAGMWDHISKPLNVDEMFGTIAKWIKPSYGKKSASLAPEPQGEQGNQAEGLSQLPGIDLKAGMATTMNKEALYRKLLDKFLSGQGTFEQMFRDAQQSDDVDAPTRVAHTLKGTAGNIGAKGVQAVAAALEKACKDGATPNELETLLPPILTELEVVLGGIRELKAGEKKKEGAHSAKSSMDLGELQSKFDQLRALLEDSDSEAIDFISELATKLEGSEIAAKLEPLSELIANFEFDEALDALKDLKIESPGSVDMTEIRAKIDQLCVLLDDSDSEAIDFVSELMQSLEGNAIVPKLEPAAEFIANFEFDEALEILKDLKLE
jgi:CheY-like chemotaxis protein